MPEVPLAVEFDEAAAVLAVSGDLDEESTETLRRAIEEHSAGFTTGLTVDLTGATYLPSVAVGVLVRAGAELRGVGRARSSWSRRPARSRSGCSR